MAELAVQRRLQAIEKLAVHDDDGAWDAGEIKMLAEAAKTRFTDQFAGEGVAYLTALYKDPQAKFVGDGKKTLLDVLVNQARVDRGLLKKLNDKLKEGYARAGESPAGEAEVAAPAKVARAGAYAIVELDYGELEEMIEKHYGMQYEIVASEEWGNDSQHRFDVKKGDNSDYEKESIADWLKDGNANYILSSILNDMADKGHIEEGKYLVTVCW